MKYRAFRFFWTWNFLILIFVLLIVVGCSENHQFGHPSLEPASAEVQIHRAVRFDPYPDPNIGTSIPGSRPPEYDIPSISRNVTPRMTRVK